MIRMENAYAGRCATCGDPVPARAGSMVSVGSRLVLHCRRHWEELNVRDLAARARPATRLPRVSGDGDDPPR